MDVSWNSSQWVSLHRDVSPTHSDDDLLLQLDGLTDKKSTVCVYLIGELPKLCVEIRPDS